MQAHEQAWMIGMVTGRSRHVHGTVHNMANQPFHLFVNLIQIEIKVY